MQTSKNLPTSGASLNDLAVAAMCSFVGFGLLIGIAQASIIEPNFRSYQNVNHSPKLQRMVSQEARRINSMQVLGATSTVSYFATSTASNLKTLNVLPAPAANEFRNFVAKEYNLNGVNVQEVTMPPLMPGWNAVTLPVEPTNANIQTILSPIAGKYSRVMTVTGGTKVFDPKLAAFATLKELHAGQGFLINITGTSTLYLKAYGYKTSGYFSSLSSGWNLAGLTGFAPSSVVGLVGQSKAFSVYTLTPGSKDTISKVYYPSFTYFEPGRSYYINNN